MIHNKIHARWQRLNYVRIIKTIFKQYAELDQVIRTGNLINSQSKNDMATITDTLEVSAQMHKKDVNNAPDYVQRHLRSLSIWNELQFSQEISCEAMGKILLIFIMVCCLDLRVEIHQNRPLMLV